MTPTHPPPPPCVLRPDTGAHVNVLLDNTCADNKNNEMIFFLAWLVHTNVCTEASFFCMVVGHTYSRIDRYFSTLITLLYTVPIYTVSQLCQYIYQFLQPYKPFPVVELHCLWNWKAFFAPHVHQRFTGFATNQYGSGICPALPPRPPQQLLQPLRTPSPPCFELACSRVA